MKLVIDSKGASGSLHLNISGFSIELSNISATGKVAVIEDSGDVSIKVLPVEEKLFVDKVTDNLQEVEKTEPLSEAVPEFLDISPEFISG
jgi:hypothetical protein